VPGDVPVGYSNKGGLIMNLLRDDLGTNDPNSLHYENQYSRGVPPGEYTVNLRLFRNLESRYPVPVEVTVRCSAEKSPRNIVNTKVQMNREGEEVTALRFRVDEQCNLEPNSVHSVFKPLRSPGKS
jgi:acyl-CoA thioesterase